MNRFTISLESDLALAFDQWIAEREYENRSEAVRDLIRAQLEDSRQIEGGESSCIACLSYVYAHDERALAARLAQIQHENHDLAVSTAHVHLDHRSCLETVIMKGPTARVRAFANRLCAEKGVHHGQINLIGMSPHDRHRHDGASGRPHVHFRPAV